MMETKDKQKIAAPAIIPFITDFKRFPATNPKNPPKRIAPKKVEII